MKRSKKYLLTIISMLLIFTLVVGCSSKKSSNSIVREEKGVASTEPAAMPDMAPARDMDMNQSALEPEKVITTIQVSFETTEFDKTNQSLSALIEKYKAYVESSNIYNNSHYNNKSYRYGNFTIRVPKASVSSFKAELSGIGNLINESTSKEDVTKQYTDTESRLKVITVKEDRILALLEKAEKIEDIIALENQLSQIIYEKENLKSHLINLDDKVDYSTIYINIQEVEKLSNTESIETTFGTRVKNAISDSLYSFKNAMGNLLISLIYILPFILILGVLLVLAIKIFDRIRKNNDKKLG